MALLLWLISNVYFEILHKISYPCSERCVFYSQVKIWELLDLRTCNPFLPTPPLPPIPYIGDVVQNRYNSSTQAMELQHFVTDPSILPVIKLINHWRTPLQMKTNANMNAIHLLMENLQW